MLSDLQAIAIISATILNLAAAAGGLIVAILTTVVVIHLLRPRA
jgi:hypothetical protein